MMAHPLALQLRNLQTMVEIGVDKNSTIMFPAPLMSTIGELGAFLNREIEAAGSRPPTHRGATEATAEAVDTAPTNGKLVPARRRPG
jgi:hypothetical protein